MKFVAGELNKESLRNILSHSIDDCVRVRAAIAYASYDNMHLFEACEALGKPLLYFGRYDWSVPVSPSILRWFLDQKSPNLVCKLIPEILHAKVIWWEGVGAYIGSANLTDRAWNSNVEAGVFLSDAELAEQGMDAQLDHFFDQLDDISSALTEEIYQEQNQLSERKRAELGAKELHLQSQFNKTRRLPKHEGLLWVSRGSGEKKRLERFVKEWDKTLQIMRDLGSLLAHDDNRPAWIDQEVPSGVQADQFLHAFYYQQVRDGAAHPYEKFYEQNRSNPQRSRDETMLWWKSGSYEHSHEEITIYEWAPRLRELLRKNRILNLSESEFSELASMVHAMRDHASKQPNSQLGLAEGAQRIEDKAPAFARRLFVFRSAGGKSPMETIYHVLYGGSHAELPQRLWEASRQPMWRIPHFGLSSLGEIVGWALPEHFPPRNMRTSKALRAMGYGVTVYV